MASAGGASALWFGNASCEEKPHKPRPRVLITAFHDWKDLADNMWRCRDNPTCRLVLGAESAVPPIKREGPLVTALKRARVPAEFTFVTLPVTWGTAMGLDLTAYDVVIHLGLGVYDSYDTILLEHGAYNMRGSGHDVLDRPAQNANDAIETGTPRHLKLESSMLKRYSELRRLPSALTETPRIIVSEAPSRKENTYICNETHWRALKAVGETGADARPKAAYFIHVPYAHPERERGWEELAAAVATLVGRLVAIEDIAPAASERKRFT